MIFLSPFVFADHYGSLIPDSPEIFLGETRLDRKMDREGIGSPANNGIVAFELRASYGSGYVESAQFTFTDGQTEYQRLNMNLNDGERSALLLLNKGPRGIRSIHIEAQATSNSETKIKFFGYQKVRYQDSDPGSQRWIELGSVYSYSQWPTRVPVPMAREKVCGLRTLKFQPTWGNIIISSIDIQFGNGTWQSDNHYVMATNRAPHEIDLTGERRCVSQIWVELKNAVGYERERLDLVIKGFQNR